MRHIWLPISCVAVLLAAGFAVRTLRAETVQGCSTVNARVIEVAGKNGNGTEIVLMRDNGQILFSRPSCGNGRIPQEELADEFSDGLFRFVDCGPNGPISTSYVTRDGRVALTVPNPNTGKFSEGLAPVADAHGLWGYMDRAGKMMIGPQFEQVSRFSEGVAAVTLKDQWEYIDKTGAVAIRVSPLGNQQVEEASPFQSGLALILYAKGRKSSTATINHSGKRVMRGVGEFNYGLAPAASHGMIGFVDTTGRMVVGPQFSYVPLLPFQEGLAAVFAARGGGNRAGFIDRLGRWVIPPQYENALHFCDGVAPVEVNGRWGYVNATNEMVIAPKFESAESFDDGMGAVLERGDDGRLHQEFINREGKLLYWESSETTFVHIDDSSILRKRCFLFFHCHI